MISDSLSVFFSNNVSLFKFVLCKVDASYLNLEAFVAFPFNFMVWFNGFRVFSNCLLISSAVFMPVVFVFCIAGLFSYRYFKLFSSYSVSFWYCLSNSSFYFLRYASISLCWFYRSTRNDGRAMQLTNLFMTCFFKFGRFMFFLFLLSNRSSMKTILAFTLSTMELFSSLLIFPPLAPRLCTKSSRSTLILKDGLCLMISLIFWYYV